MYQDLALGLINNLVEYEDSFFAARVGNLNLGKSKQHLK